MSAVNEGYSPDEVMKALERQNHPNTVELSQRPKSGAGLFPFLIAIVVIAMAVTGLLYYKNLMALNHSPQPAQAPMTPVAQEPAPSPPNEQPTAIILPSGPKENAIGVFSPTWNPLLFTLCRSYIGANTQLANSCYEFSAILSRNPIYCEYKSRSKESCYYASLTLLGQSSFCTIMGNLSDACFWLQAMKDHDPKYCQQAGQYSNSCRISIQMDDPQKCFLYFGGEDRFLCNHFISTLKAANSTCLNSGSYVDACQFSVAVSRRTPAYCPSANNSLCMAIIADLTNDQSVCADAINPVECGYYYALQSQRLTLCEGLTGEFKSNCYRAFALSLRSKDLCLNTSKVDDCKIWVDYFMSQPQYSAPPTGAMVLSTYPS